MPAVGRLYTDSWQRTYRGLLPDGVAGPDDPSRAAAQQVDPLSGSREENGLFVLERDGAVAGLCGLPPPPGAGGAAPCWTPSTSPPEAQGRRLGAAAHRPGGPVGRGSAGFRELVGLCGPGQRAGPSSLYRGMGAQELYAFHDPGTGPLLGPGLGGLELSGSELEAGMRAAGGGAARPSNFSSNEKGGRDDPTERSWCPGPGPGTRRPLNS